MLIFDLETDGLIADATVIHCLCIYDTQTDQTFTFNDKGSQEPIVRGVQFLEDADCIIGHNIIGFDIPILSKFYPWFRRSRDCIDTLVLSHLLHPDLKESDLKRPPKFMPKNLYGRHNLESYGYRLGEYKGTFAHQTDWKNWSEEMEEYMEQDVKVTRKLWKHFQPYLLG